MGRVTPDGAGPERRSFLRLAWLGIGFAALGEAVWIVASFLKPRRPARTDAGSLVVAGPSDAFTPGSVTAFPAGKFYLVGCSVPWDEAPIRRATFDLSQVTTG